MFTIRDTDYDDSYLTIDVVEGGIEFNFVDGPKDEEKLTIVVNTSQLMKIVNILEDVNAKPTRNLVSLPQVSEFESLDVCNLRSFEEYMLTLEEAGIGISMTIMDKELLVSYIKDYISYL
ncbi:gp228 [Bacillus phage W.Ph.]|uniref:Gp228 n=1 Tax=Bacillus phage W.Ph. TaxID=764595 RepID=G9B1X9_9CAUD|nr:gp228 [Bacillus phage W.Ph.]ADH03374.1 gp228 [Bacillus phage W.Ph.]